MRYQLLFYLAVMCFSTSLPAQINRALKLMESGEFAEAESLFRATLTDERERVIGLYGIALIYAAPEYPAHRLDSAYHYVESARAAYRELDYKDKGKINKDLSSSQMNRLRTEILKTALEEADETNTLAGYERFIEDYPDSGSRYEGKATAARNQLAFEAARSSNTETAYTDLLRDYGDALKAGNRNLYDAAQKLQFERYIEQKGWTGYADFAEQYPDHIYVRDSLFEEFKSLWYGPVTGYRDFIANYPEAPITRYAVDSLGMRLSQQADTVLSRQFLAEYAEHPARDAVYGAWYESLKPRFRSVSDLERFRVNNPDFPYPERLQADEEGLLDKSYEKLEVGKALGAFRAFIDKYPHYSRIDSVWLRYYQTYKLERPGAEQLDRFLKVHPEFPLPELVAADRKIYLVETEREEWAQLQAGEGTASLFRYLKAKPDSPYRDEAVTLLVERLLTDGQYQSIEGFIREYPEHESRPDLLRKLWDLFPEKNQADAISTFIETYPDYPEPEVLQTALTNVPLTDAEVMTFTESKREGFVRYIRSYAPEPRAFDALWRMLENDFAEQDWEKIYRQMQEFEQDFGDQHPEYIQWLGAFKPGNCVEAKGISPNINSDLEEYSAVITADDQAIYFCRNMLTSGINEDIYVAYRDEAGNWQEAQPVGELITDDNEAPEGISADGNRMLAFVEGRICTTEKTKDGWSKPKPMNNNINRSSWQADARVTADGKAIIFTSEAGVIRGNKDIYVSLLQEDGSWGPAISLGDSINTEKDDRSPFLHPDMKTLYFSSAGHRGLGRLDIFVSKRLDDSWTNWSTPINLGTCVNTPENDWSFKVTTDGKQGYFNVLSSGGGGDIFIMPLPDEYRPEPVATVSGLLTSIDGGPIEAVISWVNLETGEFIQNTTSDPETGTFFATLPSLGRYGYTIKKEGYVPISDNLDFSAKLYHRRLEKAMTIISLKEMQDNDLAVPLNNLFFETAKFDIKPESFPELNGLAEWVKDNDLSIEVHGHTDTVGDADDNLLLSENRAKAVRKYLIDRGLEAERIQAKGFGETKPVESNDTAEGRALNRRVEIKISNG